VAGMDGEGRIGKQSSEATAEEIAKHREWNRKARAEVESIFTKHEGTASVEAPFRAKIRRQLSDQFQTFFAKIRTDQLPSAQIADAFLELTMGTITPVLTEEADRVDVIIEALQMEVAAWRNIAASRDELRAAVELRLRMGQ
jgi:hypothetical protein